MQTSLPQTASLRILIAEDSDSDRLILTRLVSRLGHQVIEATDGAEAVRRFREAKPDLVLLDALMPRMDGMECARQIKALAGDELVPVIFLTSLTDAGSLADCLDAGGDDFIAKPYNRVILAAKIQAFNRMRVMHRTLAQQRDSIRARNEQLLDEQSIAKRVFDNVAHTGCLDAPHIRYYASPMSIFNGDILFACPRPAGGMHILIGDFTGHGLPAAIGAMPVAEIFYGMTTKGFAASEVLQEINQKLRRILPTGMFCCAAMVEADFHLGQVGIWNGGLPDGFLLRRAGGKTVVHSTHLPLGVLDPDHFDATLVYHMAEPGDSLLLMTDGVLEASGADDIMLGEEGVRSAVSAWGSGAGVVEHLVDRVREHTNRQPDKDDMTLIALEIVEEQEDTGFAATLGQSALQGPVQWACSYEISGPTLGRFSPLPLLLHVCTQVSGLRRCSGAIYTMLAELYNNALEHGVLRLPSEWKASAGGFARYYLERQRRLCSVEDHFIRFDLRHRQTDSGGELTITCEDSGEGFDPAQTGPHKEDGACYAGRGLMLLQELADEMTINMPGNRVEVVYHWQAT